MDNRPHRRDLQGTAPPLREAGEWCRVGELASALGVKSATLSVWLADNRDWLKPYRKPSGSQRYLYYKAAVETLHGINKRGAGRRVVWEALKSLPLRRTARALKG
jgi:hypothetical protein